VQCISIILAQEQKSLGYAIAAKTTSKFKKRHTKLIPDI
jgi:hypothetical protein